MPDVAPFPDSMTLGEVRALLRDNADDGITCPACARNVKVYERTMTSASARAIIALLRTHGRDFGHMPTVAREHLADIQGQAGYLLLGQHWGLIEDERRVRPDGGRAGFWRVTERGEAFAHDRLRIPERVRVFNGAPVAPPFGRLVCVSDVLGKHFDLGELLGPRAVTPTVLDGQGELFTLPTPTPTPTPTPAPVATAYAEEAA